MNVAHIYEGWRNHLFPPKKLKRIIQKVSDQRMLICRECEHDSIHHFSLRPDEHCILCDCTLSAKTKCLSCGCDVHKWESIMTAEQEEEINEADGQEIGNKENPIRGIY